MRTFFVAGISSALTGLVLTLVQPSHAQQDDCSARIYGIAKKIAGEVEDCINQTTIEEEYQYCIPNPDEYR